MHAEKGLVRFTDGNSKGLSWILAHVDTVNALVGVITKLEHPDNIVCISLKI